MIHAEDSDLYDVLVYVAFQNNPLKRIERADQARSQFGMYKSKQRVFLYFVLKQYVNAAKRKAFDGSVCRSHKSTHKHTLGC